MLLIADSGSSKTDWRLISPDGEIKPAGTAGFNPYFQTSEEIYTEILRELPTQLGTLGVKEIYFYGAGCSTEKNRSIVQEGVGKLFPGGPYSYKPRPAGGCTGPVRPGSGNRLYFGHGG